MRWFGESWGAPVCRPENKAPVPTTLTCYRCGQRIREGDQGFLDRAWSDADENFFPWVMHKNCFLRNVLPESMWRAVGCE
jgi:hypothetical protein